MSKLTPKQQRFVDEYILDLNATQAAIRAGYSEKTAREQGARLLSKVNIQAAIQELMQERSEKTRVDAQYVLDRLHQIDQLDVGDILDDAGNVLPIKQWPKAWRQSISGADLMEMQAGDVMTVVRKIKWPDKPKVLELIGKHINVKAFESERETGAEDMAAALAKIAERLPG